MAEYRIEARLERARRLGIELARPHPQRSAELELGLERSQAAVAAVDRDPAVLVEIALGPGLAQQNLVLAEGARQQRPHDPGRFDEFFRF